MEQEKQPQNKIKWSNPHAESDYEYVNSGSKNIWSPLIILALFGLGSIAFAWFRYKEMLNWIETGGTIRMNSLEKLCYDIAGIWLFPTLMAAFGVFMIFLGIRQYLHRKRLRDQ
ncbi:MAG TPA: hypothetical protein VM802_23630 [Chitinophaga sp.]|uniref:hypothetical protein n=1 Tax=Chitinophaga sp. TaxID=1869181 RepID=UPI002BE30CAB|nr:hypothetical protein [Chitinophaga sp.]HVI47880.1 hypothetical protein [Chitinophaga sp.]